MVSDFKMPKASGLEEALAIWAIRSDLPMVIVSDAVSDDLLAGARAAGVQEVVYKQKSVKNHAHAIRQLLEVKAI